jgi:hypothetical protein
LQHRQRISRVIGYAPVGLSGRTRRLLLTAALAVLVAWIALGWADHSEPSVLIWLLSPGLPLALHVPVAATGFLNGLAKVAMIALLIDFAYYAALIYAGLSWVSQRQTR